MANSELSLILNMTPLCMPHLWMSCGYFGLSGLGVDPGAEIGVTYLTVFRRGQRWLRDLYDYQSLTPV